MADEKCVCEACDRVRKMMTPEIIDANKTAYRLIDLVAGSRIADADALIGTLSDNESANVLRSAISVFVARETKIGTDPAGAARLRRFADNGLAALARLEDHVA